MRYEFSIVPASSGPLWVLAVLGVLMVGLVSLFSYLAWSSRHVTFEVSPEGLSIRGDMYGRSIAAAALRPESARARPETRHRVRSQVAHQRGGVARLPRWLVQVEERRKALLFVTDPSRVAYVPTSEGYAVMMSAEDPQALVNAVSKVPHGAPASR